LVLLARGVERFVLTSSGISCEFDADDDTWAVREDARVAPGTTVACTMRRVPSRASRDTRAAAPTHP
jgi:hypothetical protein